MTPISPVGMRVRDWCDRTSGQLAHVVSVLKIDDDTDWRRWGAHALAVLRRQGIDVPDPYKFAEFERWAMRFNQLVQDL